MGQNSKKELERARRVKEEELYQKEGYKKAVYLGRDFTDYTNHLFAFLIDLNICLTPVYLWGVEFILILTGVIPPAFFDLLFYLMYGLLFLTSCIMLPLYTAAHGGRSWGCQYIGMRLVRADKQPASAIRLVLRQLFGFGIPLMLFGYFFSFFGIFAWWGAQALVVLLSPRQQTIFDWVFNLVDVYTPRYEMKVVKEPTEIDQKGQQEVLPAPADPAAAQVLSSAARRQSTPAVAPAAPTSKISKEETAKPKKGRKEKTKDKTKDKTKEKEKAKDKEKTSEKKQHRNTSEEGSSPVVQVVEPLQPKPEISKIDLHIRSNFSDDSDAEVEEIFQQAQANHMEVISITDHNNARANALALHFAKLYHIKYIPGVEIDCQLYGERVRILGYYINWNDPFFDGVERLSLKREKDVSQARITALEKAAGLKIDTDSLLANSRFKILKPRELTDLVFETDQARDLPAVAQYLQKYPDEKAAREHFRKDYFGPGGKCEVRTEYPGAIKVIDAIHKAGGMAILSGWRLDEISNDVITALLEGGIDGFEVFAPNNSDRIKAFLLALVNDEKLFITAGSDYHGTCKRDRQLGVTTATPKGEQFVSIFTRAVRQS